MSNQSETPLEREDIELFRDGIKTDERCGTAEGNFLLRLCDMALRAAERGEGMGYALAMRVLQSDLYQQLDDLERGECDALIRAGQQTMLTAAEERKDG